MKKSFLLPVLFLLTITTTKAQVGINKNNTPPDPSAMLDVKDANKGMLMPRVALTGTNDVTTIPSPTVSLMVYNTATTFTPGTAVTPGFYYWNGSAWIQFVSTATLPAVPEVVDMKGTYNAATTYALNDLVSTGANKDSFYYSLSAANIGHTPASSPAFWREVEVEDLKQIHKSLGSTSSGLTSLLSMQLTGTNAAGGRIQYTIRATDGSQIATETGMIEYLATPNSVTTNVTADDKKNLGTVSSGATPGFFNPGSQPGVSVYDNISFNTPASVTQHDVYFRIYPTGGQLTGGAYTKVRIRLEQ